MSDLRGKLITKEGNRTELYAELLFSWRAPGLTDWQSKAEELGVSAEALRRAHARAREFFGDGRKGFQEEIMPDDGGPFDLEEWNIVKRKHSVWGKPDNLQISDSITVTPKNPHAISIEQIESILKTKPGEWNIEPLSSEGEIGQVVLTDLHIGKERDDSEEVLKLVARKASDLKVDRWIVTSLGDILHYAGSKKQTVSGTQLNASEKTPYENLEAAFTNLSRFLSELRKTAPVDVYAVLGNHSDILEYALWRMLEESLHVDIAFYISQKVYNAVMIHGNLVGLTHGDVSKQEAGRWLPRLYQEHWGISNLKIVHAGHTHVDNLDNSGACPVRYYAAMCGDSDWEEGMGFTKLGRYAHINIWNVNGYDDIAINLDARQ